MISDSRREFLKKALTAGIFTAVCPHILLGQTEPELKPGKDKIMGIYRINLNDYPVLKEILGSVRIRIPNSMTDGFFAPIIVTRLPFEDYKKDFSCIYTICPHEGREVYDLNPFLREFECSGHGTIFTADGRYLTGPAAQDLTTYEVHWDKGDWIWMEIPAVISGVDITDKNNNLAYLKQNKPNPGTTSVMITYVLEKPAKISLQLYNESGQYSVTIDKGYKSSGEHSVNVDLSILPSGVYFYTLKSDNFKPIVKKMIIRK